MLNMEGAHRVICYFRYGGSNSPTNLSIKTASRQQDRSGCPKRVALLLLWLRILRRDSRHDATRNEVLG